MMHDSMNEMMMDAPGHMLIAWGVLFGVLLLLTGLVVYLVRPMPAHRLSVSDIAQSGPGAAFRRKVEAALARQGPGATKEPVDTIFVLPDISHYTRFMNENRFAFAHAQFIIFELINAMIEAATAELHLSKLEGDAALFYADAHAVSDEAVGRTVMDIFAGFYSARARLMRANICPCAACRHVGSLDLKIFVHKGQAAKFTFRGSVDFFGMDVIVLHRLMKNSMNSHRYVMVTHAARSHCRLPRDLSSGEISEDVDVIGNVPATVFEISDELVAELSERDDRVRPSVLVQTWRKLRQNVRSLGALVFARHRVEKSGY